MQKFVLFGTITGAAAACALWAPPATAQPGPEPSYTTYQRATAPEPLFRVAFTLDEISVAAAADSLPAEASVPRAAVRVYPDSVILIDRVAWFDRAGLHLRDRLCPYDAIAETRIIDSPTRVTIDFLTVTGDAERLGRLRRGNLMTFSEPITVGNQQFVRGLVLSITGDIEVLGEVNKDVISLFGDVYVGPGATARGDIAGISGAITVADKGSVYGELYSGGEYFERRRPRFYREENFDFLGAFVYNRVDGATPYLGLKFHDTDSLLPSAWFRAGYALESERWRTELGIEQPLWRRVPLAAGAAYYRRLASEDDRLLGDEENTAFALLATEDYRDYWEAEGATAWLSVKPAPQWRFETRYRYEETTWRRSYRHLWSLFGGSKLFRENFSQVSEAERLAGAALIDTTALGCLAFVLDWDTHNREEPFAFSGWHATAELEWSDRDFSSDFDYRRYTLTLRRYQKVHSHGMLLLRAMHGNSDGFLPMHKRFYLGGLGTLHGYDFKEYAGTRFWMGNAEYRFEFPRSDIGASVFWDIGQIADGTKLDSAVDIKQSIGAALTVGADFRVSLARRLDRSFDNDPVVNVRLDFVF
ncbi:MAG TPA: BamA/TamA family outer membrane protein [candidate division Zixibacteria bacterium]|mgnify:FL=1|nr:BamA/TamA family outer membrane protein [candidate division Zixibacteria bacterium]MDD4917045.1 BamA/TamA family outer membrane protein [candidate division Zixibacteria bacterium]MDM7972858.1 BamA/TamA family outer membrane protein [candidate division Zixibacteria bacterium]HPM36248.1 BamA/TamA family outer membrane protein [candidate division Zixibacteria bacterium]